MRKPVLSFIDGLWWCFDGVTRASGLTPTQAYERYLWWRRIPKDVA